MTNLHIMSSIGSQIRGIRPSGFFKSKKSILSSYRHNSFKYFLRPGINIVVHGCVSWLDNYKSSSEIDIQILRLRFCFLVQKLIQFEWQKNNFLNLKKTVFHLKLHICKGGGVNIPCNEFRSIFHHSIYGNLQI